jgi:ABC-type sugar transport system permease subunit
MENKKASKRNFILVSAANLIVAFLDLFLTYIGTPNLSMEGNVLITELSLGWPALIAINIVVLTGLVLMAYYAHIRFRPIESPETDIKRYINDITYGNPDINSFLGIRWPKYWGPQIACLCWAVTIAVPIARMFIVLEWIFIDFRVYFPQYFRFVLLFPLARVDFFTAVILSWILSFVWIQLAFNKNLDRLNSLNNTESEKDGEN